MKELIKVLVEATTMDKLTETLASCIYNQGKWYPEEDYKYDDWKEHYEKSVLFRAEIASIRAKVIEASRSEPI